MKYKIKNWEQFQQYKDDRPIHWIKLHTKLLEDYTFNKLPEISQLHLMKLWLLAAKNNGQIEGDADWFARLLNAKKVDLETLVREGFIVRTDSYESVPRGEERREEENREEKRGKDNGTAIAAPPEVYPDGLNVQAWLEYVEHRKQIKARKLKINSVQKLQRFMIDQGGDDIQQAVVDQTVRNGWTGLFELKGHKPKPVGDDFNFVDWVQENG